MVPVGVKPNVSYRERDTHREKEREGGGRETERKRDSEKESLWVVKQLSSDSAVFP